MSSPSPVKSSIRKESIFSKARQSFLRSHGDRGASVKTLRGRTGAEFEGEARVIRGNGSYFLSWNCFRNYNGAVKDSSAPKYAVELLHRNVCCHEVVGHTQVVTFETGLGEVDYKFIFDLRENKLIAKNFAAALREEVAIGNNKEIKEKLGHKSSYQQSISFKYAENVASSKKKYQPEAPVTLLDIMGNPAVKTIVEPY